MTFFSPWCFQIFNDGRFNTSVPNEAKDIARRSAVRVVVDSNFAHDASSYANMVAVYGEIGVLHQTHTQRGGHQTNYLKFH